MDLFDVLSEPDNNPLNFLKADKSTQNKVTEALKYQYNSLKIPNKLDSLIIEDFTTEQIWQQVDLVNEKLETFVNEVAYDVATKDKLLIPVKVVEVNDVPECESDGQDKNEDLQADSENNSETQDGDLKYESDVDKNENIDKHSEAQGGDRFFDLKEMEKFVDQNMSDDSDGIDMFEELPSAGSEEDNPNYEDFFDNKQSKSESESDIEIEKSTFEKRNEKLKQKIEKLEGEALQEKAWPLKGEIDAKGRPINSLLEEYLEFDMTQRPAPIITEEVTIKLEDIILKRIKDRIYDDVERKIKPVVTPHELKKSIVLDQEKSKLSLAQVYEKEYLNQKSKQEGVEATDEELTEEKKKIDSLMKTLFKQLDTLSNFHYTPKMIDAEVKIISTTPAIMIEEVTPIGTSDANVLAPGEVAGEFKRYLTGKDERTATDKKRERRKKKALQSKKAKWRIMKGIDNSKTSLSKSNQLEKTDSNALKSSTKFFTKLQEDVQNQIKIKKRTLSENKKDLSAKKLKL